MAEEMLELRGKSKPQAYAELSQQLEAVLEGISDPIAEMSTLVCMLHHGFRHLWTGFYRVVVPGALLRVGPYQGTLGCLEIPFGKGVCGTVAASGAPLLIPDVHAFAGHITCDARARSEVVLPVWNAHHELVGVLDVDSDELGTFDTHDLAGLEALLRRFSRPRA